MFCNNDYVRKTRKRLGWTQQQMANFMGYSKPSANGWESGRVRIPKAVIHTLDAVNFNLSTLRQSKGIESSFLSIIEKNDKKNHFLVSISPSDFLYKKGMRAFCEAIQLVTQ